MGLTHGMERGVGHVLESFELNDQWNEEPLTFWNRVIALHAVRVLRQAVDFSRASTILSEGRISHASCFVSQDHFKGHLLSDSQFVFTF